MDDEPNDLKNAVIYAGLLILLAAVTAVIVSVLPQWYLLLLGVSNFAAGIMMPLVRAAPFAEDDSDDVALAIGLFLILGPFVGGLAYGIICLMRQDFNPAIVGIIVAYHLLRFAVEASVGVPPGEMLRRLLPLSDLTASGLATQWMIFATMAGWYAASVFHEVDE